MNCEGYEFIRSEQLQYRHRARSDALAARHIGENACRTVDAKFMTRITAPEQLLQQFVMSAEALAAGEWIEYVKSVFISILKDRVRTVASAT